MEDRRQALQITPRLDAELIGYIISTNAADGMPAYVRLRNVNPPYFEELASDLTRTINGLGIKKMRAATKGETALETRKRWTYIYNREDDNIFYYLTSAGAFAQIWPAFTEIGPHTATEVLHAYVRSLRRPLDERGIFQLVQ